MENPRRLRRLAAHRLEENLRFADALKEGGICAQRVDALARRLYGEVAARIDCRLCARCCAFLSPGVNHDDAQRLARALNLPPGEFTRRYLKPWPEEPSELTFRSTPCPMLRGRLCRCYECRPCDCRGYPHLQRPGVVERLPALIGNSFVCPIVYDVIEEMKTRFQSF